MRESNFQLIMAIVFLLIAFIFFDGAGLLLITLCSFLCLLASSICRAIESNGREV